MKPVRGVIFLILGRCCPVGISFPGNFLLLKKIINESHNMPQVSARRVAAIQTTFVATTC